MDHLIATSINSFAGESFSAPSVKQAFMQATKRRRLNPLAFGGKRRTTTRSKSMPYRVRKKSRGRRTTLRRLHGRGLRRRRSARYPLRAKSSRMGYGRRRARPRYLSAISVPQNLRSSQVHKFLLLGHQDLQCLKETVISENTFPIRCRDPLNWTSNVGVRQPLGWAEKSALFTQYRVIGAKITVSLIGATVSDADQLWGVKLMSERARASDFNGVGTRDVRERGQMGNAILIAGANRLSGMKSAVASWSAKDWYPKGTDTNTLYAKTNTLANPATIVTDPTTNLRPVFVIWYASMEGETGVPVSRRFHYKLELIVHFRHPLELSIP